MDKCWQSNECVKSGSISGYYIMLNSNVAHGACKGQSKQTKKKKKMLKSIYSSQKAQHEKLAYIYVEHWE